MKVRKCVAYRILQLCLERDLAINALARNAAIPPSTLKNIISGASQNPGIVNIKKICDALEISLKEFFDTPEFDALEQEIE